jgi:hypothetical protein
MAIDFCDGNEWVSATKEKSTPVDNMSELMNLIKEKIKVNKDEVEVNVTSMKPGIVIELKALRYNVDELKDNVIRVRW